MSKLAKELSSEDLEYHVQSLFEVIKFFEHDLGHIMSSSHGFVKLANLYIQDLLADISKISDNKELRDILLPKITKVAHFQKQHSRAISRLLDKSHFIQFIGRYATNVTTKGLYVCHIFQLFETLCVDTDRCQFRLNSTSSKSLQVFFPPPLLECIFDELINNAMTANAKINQTLKIEFNWGILDGCLWCEVHDSGVGFPGVEEGAPNQLFSVFSPSGGCWGLRLLARITYRSDRKVLIGKSPRLGGGMVRFEVKILGHSEAS